MPDKKTAVDDLKKEWMSCTRCPLHEERTYTVFGEGPLDAAVMLIGEGPGSNEDTTGRPFVGRSGQFLGHILRLAGLDRDQVFITNTVQCRPTAENEQGRLKDRAPSKKEMAACRPRLDELIYLIDPIVIVAIGKTSALSLTGLKSLPKAMKDVQQAKIQGRMGPVVYPVVSVFHPSYLERRANNKDLYQLTVDQFRHVRLTMDALADLGRGRPWKDKEEEKQDG